MHLTEGQDGQAMRIVSIEPLSGLGDSTLTPRILLGCLYHPAQMETYSDFRHRRYFSPSEQSRAAG